VQLEEYPPAILFDENSRFWDDVMSVIVADVVKELACCLHVQSLSSKENLACIDPEDGGSKIL
jgi:hypothetical protein